MRQKAGECIRQAVYGTKHWVVRGSSCNMGKAEGMRGEELARNRSGRQQVDSKTCAGKAAKLKQKGEGGVTERGGLLRCVRCLSF